MRWEMLEHPPNGLDLSHCNFYAFRILKTVLHFHLDDEGKEDGQDFFKNQPRSFQSEEIDLLPKRWDLYEAHFWLNGYVNKQNSAAFANPQVYVETPLHPEKLTVGCALWAGGILQKR
ncbi:mariner Mos1 transposase [Trichonephila clavipes]|nr:mariner Mos1 transposase [Trichonephila clavipes]